MAYWQNGKLFLHGSTQSVAQTIPFIARWVGIDPSQVVLISEYCGGGFGSKALGANSMSDPGPAVKEDRPSGDDADSPEKRKPTLAACGLASRRA